MVKLFYSLCSWSVWAISRLVIWEKCPFFWAENSCISSSKIYEFKIKRGHINSSYGKSQHEIPSPCRWNPAIFFSCLQAGSVIMSIIKFMNLAHRTHKTTQYY
jgi:hypothetical protein